MLERLELRDFKSFREAAVPFGPLTLLVGTNASGKSNLRDALRFLHGIGQGYPLAEILGEKYGPGGILQWRGIRGGVREASFHGTERFSVSAAVRIPRGMEHAGAEPTASTARCRSSPRLVRCWRSSPTATDHRPPYAIPVGRCWKRCARCAS